MKKILFNPFDFQKWLILGFLAFVQSLGGGCDGTNVNMNFPSESSPEIDRLIQQGVRFVTENLAIVFGIGALLLLIGAALLVLFQWLSARAGFSYLKNIVSDSAEVAQPWSDQAKEADSFFLFRLAFSFVSICLVLLLIFPMLAMAWSMAVKGDRFSMTKILFATGSLVSLALLIPTLIGITLFQGLLTDFVMPIQFQKKISCISALADCWVLIKKNFVAFILYALMKLCLRIVSFIAIAAACCLTACVLFCCILIPVIGQALLQPVFVFFRSYSIMFLRQFGEEFDCFTSGPGTNPALEG